MIGGLEVIDGGIFTTIQDTGRTGLRKYGIPQGGVMDTHNYRLANWLVSNLPDSPVLEMTMEGGSYRFTSDAYIALTGAPMDAKINGESCSFNKTLRIKKADILTLGYTQKGCRSYLAIHGNWNIKKSMNSYSTYTPAEFGGLNGHALAEGDRLMWKEKGKCDMKEVPKALLPHFARKNRIRVIAGPDEDRFSEEQKSRFFESEFKVHSRSNRMGIRLTDAKRTLTHTRNITSSGVVPGIVQIPQNGQPIVLASDGQTVGGYPRIAKVIDADLWRIGQVFPEALIYFKKIDIYEAIDLKKHQESLYIKNLY